MAFTLQFAMLIGLYLFIGASISLGFGLYMFSDVLFNDIKHNFNLVNKKVNSTEEYHQVDLLKLFASAIRLHSVIKELSQKNVFLK